MHIVHSDDSSSIVYFHFPSRYKIVTAGSGRSHTVVVTDDGISLSFGWNKHGQLGTGSAKNGAYLAVCFFFLTYMQEVDLKRMYMKILFV